MKTIENLIKSANKIALFFHINPDGDAVGSALALYNALKPLGKEVVVFSEDKIDESLRFLDENVINFSLTKEKFDLGIILDCNETSRIGIMEKILPNCEKLINIDHHIVSSLASNFDYEIRIESASSTCEIVYKLLKEMNIEITSKVAKCLYTGLATDTGSFMFSLSSDAHNIAGDLVAKIDNVEEINYVLFRKKRKTEINLLTEALKRLEFFLDNKLSITYLVQEDFEKFNADFSDTSSIVYLLSGLDVSISCVISEEKKGVFKVSLRSHDTDVCSFARVFGGGGHKFASGCKIYGTKNTVISKIIEKAKEYLGEE